MYIGQHELFYSLKSLLAMCKQTNTTKPYKLTINYYFYQSSFPLINFLMYVQIYYKYIISQKGRVQLHDHISSK